MSDKKEVAKEVKAKVLNVEITAKGAHGKEGEHKIGEKLKLEGQLPGYLVGKCKVLVNGKA
jgi:hypothetical protein